MIKFLQDGLLLIVGYIFILIILGGWYFFTKVLRMYREDDTTTIVIREWKDIQVKNRGLKKEMEIQDIENQKLERINKDILDEIKDTKDILEEIRF